MKSISTFLFSVSAAVALGQGQVCAVMSPISQYAGQPVGQLQLQVGTGLAATILTPPNAGGCLDLTGLPLSNGAPLQPYKNINPMNGVSTFDLVKIAQHILGTQPFNSCYELIAADFTGNGAITTFDIVELRKVILGIQPGFPGQPSWRFISKNCADPCLGGCPTCVFGTSSNADCTFYGIKMGDVTGDADTDNYTGQEAEDRSPVRFSFEDRLLRAGETADLPIFLEGDADLLGWQLALGFDPSFLEIEETLPENPDGPAAMPMVALTAPGRAAMNWFSASPQTFRTGRDALISLRIKALRDCQLSEALFLEEKDLRPKAYLDGGRSQPVELVFSKKKPAAPGGGLAVWPNPFSEKTTLEWSQAEPGEATVEVFDATGGRVFHQKTWGNRLVLGGFGEGLFFVKIQSGSEVFTASVLQKN